MASAYGNGDEAKNIIKRGTLFITIVDFKIFY